MLVSIIIPTYNRAHTIAAAIRSALEQSFADFELIIADDGSTDETEQVVREVQSPRVRYVRKPNGGCSSARNFGVQSAAGKYVAFLDSDDSWDPHWLRTVTGILEGDAGIGAVYGSLQLIGAGGTQTGVFDLSVGGRFREATVPYVLQQCAGLLGSNVVARRDVVLQIGGWDESFPTSGDLDFGLRLASVTRVAIVAQPMIRLVETAGSLSKKVNTGNRVRVLEKFIKNHPQLAGTHARILRQSRARILLSYGEDLLWFRRIGEAERQLLASLRIEPNAKAIWLLAKAQALKLMGPSKAAGGSR